VVILPETEPLPIHSSDAPRSSSDKPFLCMTTAYSALADGTPRAMLFMFLIALQARPAGSGPHRSSHANPRWGVVQLVGHLTVNEDGEGSNPSAPANFPLQNPTTALPELLGNCSPRSLTLAHYGARLSLVWSVR
jgi:hypothetical protein